MIKKLTDKYKKGTPYLKKRVYMVRGLTRIKHKLLKNKPDKIIILIGENYNITLLYSISLLLDYSFVRLSPSQ